MYRNVKGSGVSFRWSYLKESIWALSGGYLPGFLSFWQFYCFCCFCCRQFIWMISIAILSGLLQTGKGKWRRFYWGVRRWYPAWSLWTAYQKWRIAREANRWQKRGWSTSSKWEYWKWSQFRSDTTERDCTGKHGERKNFDNQQYTISYNCKRTPHTSKCHRADDSSGTNISTFWFCLKVSDE